MCICCFLFWLFIANAFFFDSSVVEYTSIGIFILTRLDDGRISSLGNGHISLKNVLLTRKIKLVCMHINRFLFWLFNVTAIFFNFDLVSYAFIFPS